jgi:hypothetical protein
VAQTFTKIPLSGSTDGQPIKIGATATAGTTIHTATSSAGSDSMDEVWLWASSTSASAINASLQIGTVTNDQQTINFRVPAAYNGPVAILPGHPLRNGTVVTATAATAERINIFGYVNRISLQSS